MMYLAFIVRNEACGMLTAFMKRCKFAIMANSSLFLLLLYLL